MENRKLELWMSVALILCAFALAGQGWRQASGSRVETADGKRTVVVDPGHGGKDPGKIGVDDSLEKEINLEIARKVQAILESQDVEVILTRESDEGLYEESASNKKVQDLKNRCALINETQPDCAVSIHQNSYHEEYVSGAQVFYYGNSEEGKRLAETIQGKLVDYLDPENRRQAKANESYYLLKKTEVPIVIVECGFLSNWEEAKLLQDDGYQSRAAWAVAMGVVEYLNAR
ncbi:MAG: N-acetylmuramoyl-L-alanine amidase CwlD [Eubacteriales bacterium]|nr:N-acetylmuramoyl-L-alanine amidase CwlD [Eubacteriales bacterium]